MLYKECPLCGATLDPEEKCDCVKEKGLPDANQNSPKRDTKSHDISIAQKNRKIKSNPLRDLRISKNLSAKEMVLTVRALYPKFDKMLQSHCEHGEEYGIDLKTKAMDALLAKYAPELLAKEKHRRDGCHRLKCKVSCRLEDDEYAELVKRIKEDGFDTMQAWLAFKIRAYLKSKPSTQTNS
jgi:hypothetical protein